MIGNPIDGNPPVEDMNTDFDCVCDTLDCADADSDFWLIPGEVTDLLFTNGTTILGWNPPLIIGGTSVVYDTIQCPLANDFTNCCFVEENGSDATATDTTTPPPGAAGHYLTRAGNICDEGTWGDDSSGNPRPVPPNPPSCP